jgi:predicted nuclease of restriction endonuclease-like RecB superfamily
MLTKAQRVYHWDRPSNSISSDRLEDDSVPLLRGGIAAYRGQIGRRRGDVRNAARTALIGLRPDRVEAIVKLLDDAARYEWPRGARQADRRLRVFDAAAVRYPIQGPEAAWSVLEGEFGHAPGSHAEAVGLLYPDYPEYHRLVAFPEEYTAEDLRADYDLAQAQALLYDAARIEVDACADLRHIVQYARLSRLLHRVERAADQGYRLTFDGPNSILRRTHAYGVDFAKFLAALVQARNWRMRATIMVRNGWRPATFTLASTDALRSRVPAPRLFDSGLEERFAAKFGETRDGWHLSRETLLFEAGERLLVPDFVFRHDDGTEVALEIVGYWTPEYLADKFEKLALVTARVPMIVAVQKTLALEAGRMPPLVLPFGTSIPLKTLMPRLDALRPARGHWQRRRPPRSTVAQSRSDPRG